jgi:hypothetical protein
MSDLSVRALITLEEARRYVFRDENDGSRDDLLIDAINDVSAAIFDHCEREFMPTTLSRAGADGVGNGTTTFVAATGAFVAGDVGAVLLIAGIVYTIVSRTNATTVVLSSSVATATGLAWDFGEARVFSVTKGGYIDLRPFDLRTLMSLTLYTDQAAANYDVLTADEYELMQEGPPSGTVFQLRTIAPALAELQTGFGWKATIRGQWGMAAVPASVRFACKQWVKNSFENPGSYASAAMSGYAVIPETDTLTLAPAGMPAAVRYRLERWARGYPIR